MLIFGIRVLFQVLATGTFQCPTCRSTCTYEKRQGRRWGHLFWIPLLPLGDVGDPFVRCTRCRTDYVPQVLDLPTEAQLEDWLNQGARAFLSSLARASADRLAAESAALHLLQQTVDATYNAQALEHDIARFTVDQAAMHLRRLNEVLTDSGKEALLTRGLLVAHAGGTVTSQQSQMIVQIAIALGMSQATVRGLNYEAAAALRKTGA